ncbi:MAG: histidine phosphatase family protein [Polyangiaceae bacterium]
MLIRHGQAEGNVDPHLFETKPDHMMALTERGIEEARHVGAELRALFGEEKVRVYVSPYLRAKQTLRELGLSDLVDRVIEEPRLREQDWGNFQHRERIAEQKAQRSHFGHFFYRMQHGESGADVYDRVSAFTDSLFRNFNWPDYPPNVLLVTHGLTMRLFMMRWFHWTVDYFESLENPHNCELKMLTDGPNGYVLNEPFRQWKDVDAGPLSDDR